MPRSSGCSLREPRLRALHECRIGRHLKRNEEGWLLVQDPRVTKMQTISELPLGERASRIVDRYILIERRELLAGREHDAMWITEVVSPSGERACSI